MRLLESRYYKISEFANLIGVSTNTLREWEKNGVLIPHHKTPSGYRIYAHSQYEEYFKGIRNKRGSPEVGG